MAPRLILDAGAVIALAARDARARAHLDRARASGAEVVVPAVVVAETVRGHGPRDAPVNRVLIAVGDTAECNEALAREAGRLLADTGSHSTIDALVVAEAARRTPSIVLTGDPVDLRLLAAATRGVTVASIRGN